MAIQIFVLDFDKKVDDLETIKRGKFRTFYCFEWKLCFFLKSNKYDVTKKSFLNVSSSSK